MLKAGISEKLIEELIHMVRYTTEPNSQIIKFGYIKHPISRRITMHPDKEYREKEIQRVKVTMTALVQKIVSENKPFKNCRCPECGKRITTRRCFICDLENGLIKETY